MKTPTKKSLNKLISFMVRQGSPERSRRAHHERNQQFTVRPEPVEGFNQRSPRQRSFYNQGFTLLEILIALAIFAIMSMMAYAGLAAVLDARAATEPRSEQMAQLQTALYLLNEDLSQAINRPIRDELGGSEPAFSGGRGNEILVFTRSVPTWSDYASANSLQRVSYRFENGALYRQVWTLPDRTLQTQYRRRKLMSAEQVAVRFYSQASQTWLPFNGSNSGIPNAIEISFNLAGLGSIQRSFLIRQ